MWDIATEQLAATWIHKNPVVMHLPSSQAVNDSLAYYNSWILMLLQLQVISIENPLFAVVHGTWYSLSNYFIVK